MGALKLSKETLAELDDLIDVLKLKAQPHVSIVPTVACNEGCSSSCSGSCSGDCSGSCYGSN